MDTGKDWSEMSEQSKTTGNIKKDFGSLGRSEEILVKMVDDLVKSRDAWKKLAEELAYPKHAYRYYCMWCGNLIVNIGHSPDCPIEQLRKMQSND